MHQYAPPGPVAPRPPAWLWALPVFSCGLLSFLPALVIAGRLKRTGAWWGAGAITAAWFLGIALPSSDASNLGGSLYLAAWAGGIVYSLVMGPKVAWPGRTAAVGPAPYDPNAAAVAQVQAQRRRREEARALASRDPLMARELRIGRPDLPRNFDDGGLVDVNSAPEEALVRGLGLSPAQAGQVLAARQRLSRFEHPDDLVNLAGLEPAAYDQVRDRVILM